MDFNKMVVYLLIMKIQIKTKVNFSLSDNYISESLPAVKMGLILVSNPHNWYINHIFKILRFLKQ